MKSRDNISKIKATLLYILNKIPSGADYIKIFKILYFAQQSHLVTYGRVIVDDSFRALKRGPVPSFLYKALKSRENDSYETDDFKFCVNEIVVTDNGTIKLFLATALPDMDELSKSDIKCLDKAIDDYKDIDSNVLSEMSHEDRAWIVANERFNNDPGFRGIMTPIEIAESGGAKKGVVEFIRENQLIDNALYYNE